MVYPSIHPEMNHILQRYIPVYIYIYIQYIFEKAAMEYHGIVGPKGFAES